MSGKKNVETSVAPSTVSGSSAKLPEKDMGKEIASNPVSSTTSSVVNATSGFKGGNQPASADHSVYYPPSFDYYPVVPTYGDKGYGSTPNASYAGMPSDNGSMMYYYPGYTPYTTGYMSVDGKQQAYASSDYSYGSESFPQYSYDPNYSGNGTTGVGTVKTAMGLHGTGKPNVFTDAKTNNNVSRKATVPPLNSRVHHSSSFSRPSYQNQQFNNLNKPGSSFQSTNLMKGFQPAGRYSSYTNRNANAFMQYSPVNYQSNGRGSYNHRYKSRDGFGKNGDTEGINELTRGPRGDNVSKTMIKSDESENQGLPIEKDNYNSENFQTEYENAKFFVIKSFSEDDVHKCVKYDVWSSTHNGNLKLDAAFREAAESSETGTRCPVFLFFSVNASGQFVGVAEMIGQIDYSKTMDFWQLNKWNGFFPVKWHIIKDVPNTMLRHILLENNENRAVTYSRDTQEIGLKQGLEMLSIFKSYSEKTSVLDDYNFYENREKSLKMKKASKKAPEDDGFENSGYENHLDARGGGIRGEQAVKTNVADTSSLVSLTKNLSLDSQPLQSSST